ncbi:MAG: DMT family transporter [bacterium]
MAIQRRQSNLMLLLAAAIWGFAFVAQRAGMEHIGPFTFNAIRFALGSAVLVPFILWRGRQGTGAAAAGQSQPLPRRTVLMGAALAGLVLCLGSSLQQIGIVTTTAGKAGFITGLYVVIVPLLGLLRGQHASRTTWIGAVLAAAGLYLLSIKGAFGISHGDLLVFFGAFFWAGHVHIIGWLSPRSDPFQLACLQFAVVSLLSAVAALLTESFDLASIQAAGLPILYAGAMSVGVAFTLQVVAQRTARPDHTAIILSLEAAFAVLGGWLILSESLSVRAGVGCVLMLTGMIWSQLGSADGEEDGSRRS